MIVDQKDNKTLVGVYLIDGDINGVQIATTKEPTKFKKIVVKCLLGWKWISIKELKENTTKDDGN